MPYINVDIDIDDFIRDCSTREIKELIIALKEDGYLPDPDEKMVIGDVVEKLRTVHDHEWYEIIKKLANIRLSMSLDDIETIKQITKKY